MSEVAWRLGALVSLRWAAVGLAVAAGLLLSRP